MKEKDLGHGLVLMQAEDGFWLAIDKYTLINIGQLGGEIIRKNLREWAIKTINDELDSFLGNNPSRSPMFCVTHNCELIHASDGLKEAEWRCPQCDAEAWYNSSELAKGESENGHNELS